MKFDVCIVDYDMGNLFSIKCACQKVGLQTIISSNPKDLLESKCIILPGVGAFNKAMSNLRKKRLVNIIKRIHKEKRLIIGICLGMQLLFEESHEIKKTSGLGLIKGRVVSFEKKFKIKKLHVGWNKVNIVKINYLLKKSLNNKKFYFIHNFFCEPKNKKDIASTSIFGYRKFCSSIKSNNLYGFQFHPEKSGPDGLKVYDNLRKNLI